MAGLAGPGSTLHIAQAGLSGYSLFHAYNSISKLRQWEPATEKVAEYSEVAAKELHKTRTTQTAAAVTLLVSFITALVALARPSESATTRLGLSLGLATLCVLTRTYIQSFWNKKAKIPGVETYNDALNSTQEIKGHLGILALAWFMTAILEAQLSSNSTGEVEL